MFFRKAFTTFGKMLVNRMALVPLSTATGSYCIQDGKDLEFSCNENEIFYV